MLLNFNEVWDNVVEGETITVSDGTPPPSSNTQGVPYKAWKSHNFTGILEAKISKNNWRYLRLEVTNTSTPSEVSYLAYEIAEGGNHRFEIAGD